MDFWPLIGTLWLSAFTSATILPGTSEAAFAAAVLHRPQDAWVLLLAAGSGNVFGSMVSYWMGRVLPERHRNKITPAAAAKLQRYGAWALLLAWLPMVGDALPVAAGWLRLNAWYCALALAVGKFGRYAVLLWAADWWLKT